MQLVRFTVFACAFAPILAVAQSQNGFTIGGQVGQLNGSALQIKIDYSSCLPTGYICTATVSGSEGPNGAATACTQQCCSNASYNNRATYNSDGTVTDTATCGDASPILRPSTTAETHGSQLFDLAKGADHYSFVGAFPTGIFYWVSVVHQPVSPNEVCSIDNENGRVGTANVKNVNVECDAIFANGFD